MLESNIKQLTFFRFLAALWVLGFHYVVYNKSLGFKFDYFDTFFQNGNLAVNFFFVLSGFILSHVELKKTSTYFADFIKKRIFRIYPVYIISLVLSLVLSLTYQKFSLLSVFANIFSLQAIFPKLNTINIPSWSISQEFLFYIMFLPLFLFVKSNSKIFIILFFGSLFIALILNQSFFNNSLNNYPQYYWLFTSFIIGILARYCMRNATLFNFFKKYNIIILVSSIVSFVFCLETLHYNFFYGHVVYELIFAFFILAISCLNKSNALYNVFSNKALVFLGEISFSIYIFQHPIYMLSGLIIHGHPRYRFLVFILSLFITSALAFVYIEKPAGSFLQKRFLSKKYI